MRGDLVMVEAAGQLAGITRQRVGQLRQHGKFPGPHLTLEVLRFPAGRVRVDFIELWTVAGIRAWCAETGRPFHEELLEE